MPLVFVLKNKDWKNIITDYANGTPQRVLERKYDMSIRQINRQCKKVVAKLLKDKDIDINPYEDSTN